MDGNYIKLFRNIKEWDWYEDINTYRLFTHMLLTANWKDGNFKGTVIKRGSFVSSVKKLSEETKLSVQEVKTALNHLKSTNEITNKATNKFTVFTIKNYDKWQSDNQQINQQPTNEQPPNNHQSTTIEEGKKEKRKEGKKEKNKPYCTEPETSSVTVQAMEEDNLIALPLNDKTEYQVSQLQADGYKELYPAVDVEQELRKMKGWLLSNPEKKKTRRGICKFINNWLAREQDKGRSYKVTTGSSTKTIDWSKV